MDACFARVAQWLAVKRRERRTVDASVFHEYLLSIHAPHGTIEQCESNGWITFEPRSGSSGCIADYNGNLCPGPIHWVEAHYVIQPAVAKAAPAAVSASPDSRNETQDSPGAVASERAADGAETSGRGSCEPTDVLQTQHEVCQTRPTPFQGGVMTFFQDRVELCGVDICSGPRCQTRRRILELLRRKQNDGKFVAYGSEQLAAELESNGRQGTAVGAIRDLRDSILEAMRDQANFACEREDVILSKGRGYRFAENITVHDGDDSAGPLITDKDETDDVPNVRNDEDDNVRNDEGDDVRNVRSDTDDDVPNVPDDAAGTRRTWILQQFAKGAQPKAPSVAEQFKCSVKTAQRDMAALKEEGKIEFVGVPRTGCYRLCRPLKPEQ